MSYRLVQFDGAALPLKMPEDPLDMGTVLPGLVQFGGGAYDRYGSRTPLPLTRQVRFRGRFAGTEATLRTQVDALRAKLGVRGQLIRQRDDDATQPWLYARLLQVDGTWTVEDGNTAQLDCVWETAEPTWRTTAAATINGTVINGTQNNTLAIGGSAPVADGILTITASATITSLVMTIAALGISLKFLGTLTAGQAVAIDAGALTVKRDSTDVFADFSVQAGHTAYGWLPLPAATHTLAVVANNTGTLTYVYYPRWY